MYCVYRKITMGTQPMRSTAAQATLFPPTPTTTSPRSAMRRPKKEPLLPPVIANEAIRLRELAARWLVAMLLVNNAVGRKVSLSEIGAAMARIEGRSTPYDASSVHRLSTGKQEPTSAQVLSFSLYCAENGVAIDAGWLHYGEATKAPAPKTPLLDAAAFLRP